MRSLLLLAALAATATAALADDKSPAADEKHLADAFQKADGDALVELLRARARAAVEPKVLDDLVGKLDSKDAAERGEAAARLVAIGVPALAKLRVKARELDTDAALAKRLVALIEGDQVEVTGAAVRLLAARRPAGAAKALIEFLPAAEDAVRPDVEAALAGLAYDKGKPDPDLLAALSDPHSLRRGGAIAALCAGGQAEPRDVLRKMMADPSPYVRFRASLALAKANDAKAVSALVSLLSDLPEDKGAEVESFLRDLAGDQSPKVALGTDDASKQKCREAWAKWWLDNDGPNLLKEVEKRTLTDDVTAKAVALVEKLGSELFDDRQDAEAELRKMGQRVVPLLKTALTNPDLEIRNRAKKLLAALSTESRLLPAVVTRLISLRKPKGAAEALLAYAPFAEEGLDDVQAALNAVAYSAGKANPAVVKGLSDKMPARRAAAAVALASGPMEPHAAEVRQRIDPKHEKDALVRLRVALALGDARDREAVPALIALVGELPADQAAQAEEFLERLAAGSPPKDLPKVADDKSRKARSDVWARWWADNQRKVVLTGRPTEFRPRYLGQILLVTTGSQLSEIGKDGKVLWTMANVTNTRDAQWLGKDRLLVVEYPRRVTERNLKGEVLWEANVNFPVMQAQRLRNGETFVSGTRNLVVLDKNKREVFTHQSTDLVRSARKLPNGEYALVTSRGQLVRLDSTGKQTKAVQVGNFVSYQCEILDDGGVLVPMGNRVVEYSAEGKETWSVNTDQQPAHAIRLPNNNTLVSFASVPYKVVEYDAKGKKVREHQTNVYAYRVRAR